MTRTKLLATILLPVLYLTCVFVYFIKIDSSAAEEKTHPKYESIFKLKLYSDKKIYKTTDQIKIWATLKYVGQKKEIKIWHGDPAINFFITDGKKFHTGGLYNTILMSTVLKKGKRYKYHYVKNGDYDTNDPDAAFWKKFYSEKSLMLPVGKYKVTVSGAFSLSENEPNGNLKKEITINVVKQ